MCVLSVYLSLSLCVFMSWRVFARIDCWLAVGGVRGLAVGCNGCNGCVRMCVSVSGCYPLPPLYHCLWCVLSYR